MTNAAGINRFSDDDIAVHSDANTSLYSPPPLTQVRATWRAVCAPHASMGTRRGRSAKTPVVMRTSCSQILTCSMQRSCRTMRAGAGGHDTTQGQGINVQMNAQTINVQMTAQHFCQPLSASHDRLFKKLHIVVIDEAHIYRGAFGSHVACVLRR